MVIIKLKKVEEGLIPIYENSSKEKLINARELFYELRGKETKTKFADWIKDRISQYEFEENQEFIKVRNYTKVGNLKRPQIDYYLSVNMAKELCMIENNNIGKKIRKYFIGVEKRYRKIINNPNNIFDFMRLALDEIERNSNEISRVRSIALDNKKEITNLKTMIDVKIKSNYCLASDIAEELRLYSENKIPHSNLIGAIARELGFKISYKHYYEDENIAIVKDVSKNEYWQVYFKPKGVEEITKWFNKNKEEIYYEIQYIKNTKNGKKGEVKERGYKIENISYKIIIV